MKSAILLSLILICCNSFAQTEDRPGSGFSSPQEEARIRSNVDSVFRRARELAFKGNRKDARTLCRKILIVKPNYHDVRVFMARTYSWGKLYGKARHELDNVFNASPNHPDGLSVLADIELWTRNPEKALEIINEGLTQSPDDIDFVIKKARALEMLRDYDEAKRVLKELLQKFPDHEEAAQIYERVKNLSYLNSVALGFQSTKFNQYFSNQYLMYAEYKRTGKNYTILNRLNYGHKFDMSGFQSETDGYLNISQKFTSYINLGVSRSPIFPTYRYGIEFFYKAAPSLETSLGYRYLGFEQRKLIVYTGSLNKYYGNLLFSFRPYFTPDVRMGSFSYIFMTRLYDKNPYNFLEFKVGSGIAPDYVNYGTLYERLYLLKNYNAAVGFQKCFKVRYLIYSTVQLGKQELLFDTGSYIWFYNIEGGLKYRF